MASNTLSGTPARIGAYAGGLINEPHAVSKPAAKVQVKPAPKVKRSAPHAPANLGKYLHPKGGARR